MKKFVTIMLVTAMLSTMVAMPASASDVLPENEVTEAVLAEEETVEAIAVETDTIAPTGAYDPNELLNQSIGSQVNCYGGTKNKFGEYTPTYKNGNLPISINQDPSTGVIWDKYPITDEKIVITEDEVIVSFKAAGEYIELKDKIVKNDFYVFICSTGEINMRPLPEDNREGLGTYKNAIEYGNLILTEGENKFPVEIGKKDLSNYVRNSINFNGELYHFLQISHELKALSNRGDYNILIEAYNRIDIKALPEGENIIPLNDVKKMDIKITGTNNATGAVRVMNSSTIEEMVCTVENGSITNIKISGRAQVGVGGKLDRYTAEASIWYWD